MKEEAKYIWLRWLAAHIALRKRAARESARLAGRREPLLVRQTETALALDDSVKAQTGPATEAVELV
jgi:hypothetical protein